MTAVQILTLVIAVLGWVTAAGSLTWNVVSWRLTAGRGTVELAVGAVMEGGRYMQLPVTPDWRDKVRENLDLNSLPGKVALFVTIRNTGRTGITVENCRFRTPSGIQAGTVGGPDYGPRFPIRIADGDSVVLAYDAGPITSVAMHRSNTGRSSSSVRARVDLGTGRIVESKGELKL